MTEEELQAIEARLAAATPAPWEARDRGHGVEVYMGGVSGAWLSTASAYGPKGSRHRDITGTRADAALIAHAPTDLAALVAEVQRMQAALTRIAKWDEKTQEAARLDGPTALALWRGCVAEARMALAPCQMETPADG